MAEHSGLTRFYGDRKVLKSHESTQILKLHYLNLSSESDCPHFACPLEKHYGFHQILVAKLCWIFCNNSLMSLLIFP